MTKRDAINTLVTDTLERMSCVIFDGHFMFITMEWRAAIELCFIGPNKAYTNLIKSALDTLLTVQHEMDEEDLKFLLTLKKRINKWS